MTIFTELMSKKNNYLLCDILAYGNLKQYKKIEKKKIYEKSAVTSNDVI
jgi:hypothetical protein